MQTNMLVRPDVQLRCSKINPCIRQHHTSGPPVLTHVPAPVQAVGDVAAASWLAATAAVRQQRHRQAHRTRVMSVWDDSLTLSDLREKLDAAVASEDYAEAARVRDALQQRQADAKLGIEDANKKFYDAFRAGNPKAMAAIWGEGDQVQVIHPAAACIAGREMVLESWAAILRGVRPNAFKITLEDVRVCALSETTGLVTCVEVVEADDSKGRTAATNVFELQKGKWVIVLHQGGPMASARFR